MRFFERLSNGWRIFKTSFAVLKENKQLVIFPILSGISILLILSSFVAAFLASYGWDVDAIPEQNKGTNILYIFLFYLVNYFIVVFFNMALIHCTRLYFAGEEVTIKAGLQFSMSRIANIFAWAMLAATVGTILRLIEENVGWLGKIIISLIGMAWSIATFFAVPVIAYENVSPFGALKRSSQMMKDKWGESLTANFSLGIVQFVGILGAGLLFFLVGSMIHVVLGIVLAALAAMMVMAIVSAAQTIFISAVYHEVNGMPVKSFNEQLVDNLFRSK